MKYLLTSILFWLCMLSTCYAQKPAKTVPQFDFVKLDNTTFTNQNLAKDKMLFFMFFDPGCEHCQHAMMNLNKNYNDYKNTSMYLICLDDKDKINSFIKQYAPVLLQQKNVTLLRDSKNEFITRFTPVRYPSMFLYDANKKLLDYEDNEESMFRFTTTIKKTQAK